MVVDRFFETKIKDVTKTTQEHSKTLGIPIENLLLANSLIKRIWQMYDSGGHSMGRSSRSTLLEMLISELGFTNETKVLSDNKYKNKDIHQLIDEDLQLSNNNVQLELNLIEESSIIDVLSHMSERGFITLLLIFLKTAVRNWQDSSQTERDAIDKLFNILAPNSLTATDITHSLHKYNLEQLTQAFKIRAYDLRSKGEYDNL